MYLRWIQTVLLAIGLSAGAPSFAQAPAVAPNNDPHQVVFVCEHGSAKSLIASLYFNQRAQQRGLPYTAVSRGTSPGAAVPATVQQGLKGAGFDVVRYVPQPFKASDVDRASLVVSFDQKRVDALIEQLAAAARTERARE